MMQPVMHLPATVNTVYVGAHNYETPLDLAVDIAAAEAGELTPEESDALLRELSQFAFSNCGESHEAFTF